MLKRDVLYCIYRTVVDVVEVNGEYSFHVFISTVTRNIKLVGVEFKPLARPLFRPGLLLSAETCRINCCYPTDHLCKLHPSPFALQRKLSDSISALRNAHYLHSKYEDISLSFGRKEDCLKFSDKG